jgi:hypothetical protein
VDSIVSGGLRLQLGGGHGARLSRQRVTVPVNPPPAVEPHFLSVPAATLGGRDEQIQAATEAVATGGRLGFHAPPGFGKSTLLRHLASLLAAGQPTGSVVYLRAGDGRVEDLLQRLFRALYRPAEPVRPTRRELLALLARAESVVLLDDLALGPPALDALLSALPGCTAIVAADWVLPGLGGRWMELPGLDRETALDLLSSTSARPLDRIGLDAAERLIDRVDGQPLAIRLAGALVREARADLGELAGTVDGNPWALERLALTNIGDSELRTLALLTLAGSTALPVELIESVTDRTQARHDLVVLRRMALIEQEDGRVWSTVHHGEVVRRALTERLDLDHVTRTISAWLEGRPLTSERARASIPTVIAAIVLCAERGRWLDVIRLVGAVEPVLAVGARWQAWRDVLDQGLEAARAADDSFAEADFSHQLGTLEISLGRTGPGRALLLHALERRQALGDRSGAAVSRANLEMMGWREREHAAPATGPVAARKAAPDAAPADAPGTDVAAPPRRGGRLSLMRGRRRATASAAPPAAPAPPAVRVEPAPAAIPAKQPGAATAPPEASAASAGAASAGPGAAPAVPPHAPAAAPESSTEEDPPADAPGAEAAETTAAEAEPHPAVEAAATAQAAGADAAEAEGRADAHPDAHAHPDAVAEADAPTEAEAHPDAVAEADAHPRAEADAHDEAQAHPHAEAHGEAHLHPHAEAEVAADGEADADDEGHDEAEAHVDAEADVTVATDSEAEEDGGTEADPGAEIQAVGEGEAGADRGQEVEAGGEAMAADTGAGAEVMADDPGDDPGMADAAEPTEAAARAPETAGDQAEDEAAPSTEPAPATDAPSVPGARTGDDDEAGNGGRPQAPDPGERVAAVAARPSNRATGPKQRKVPTTTRTRHRSGRPPRGAVSLSSTMPKPAPSATATPPAHKAKAPAAFPPARKTAAPSAPAASTPASATSGAAGPAKEGSPARPVRSRRAVVLALVTMLLAAAGISGVLLLEAGRSNQAAGPDRAVSPATRSPATTDAARTPVRTAPRPTTLAPAQLSFGTRPAGSASESRELIVSNASGKTLGISAVAVEGNTSDFLVNTRCAGVKLANGVHCRLGVRFAPKTPGEKAVTVRIGFDMAGNQVSARATGVGR